MRQYIIAAAAAVAIIALWAAIVPRAEAPSAGSVAAPSPAMTNALRVCREGRCKADRQLLAKLDRRD